MPAANAASVTAQPLRLVLLVLPPLCPCCRRRSAASALSSWPSLTYYMVELHQLPWLGFKQLPAPLDRGTLPGRGRGRGRDPWPYVGIPPWVRSFPSPIYHRQGL
ncbi:hypothetical protein CPLU01_12111 [Colletotrichum plurivorum]|uniref:Uncharacterized protein n=1 Tax=Colletotrichum plurivorum TaxID=2175906 RepID=A0A8H6JZT6_9PEZI|nr:hypothetical protein CPLU01_12111 [Colletotrichum plurivorum]